MVDAFGYENTVQALNRLQSNASLSGDMLVSVYTSNRSSEDPYHRNKNRSIFQ